MLQSTSNSRSSIILPDPVIETFKIAIDSANKIKDIYDKSIGKNIPMTKEQEHAVMFYVKCIGKLYQYKKEIPNKLNSKIPNYKLFEAIMNFRHSLVHQYNDSSPNNSLTTFCKEIDIVKSYLEYLLDQTKPLSERQNIKIPSHSDITNAQSNILQATNNIINVAYKNGNQDEKYMNFLEVMLKDLYDIAGDDLNSISNNTAQAGIFIKDKKNSVRFAAIQNCLEIIATITKKDTNNSADNCFSNIFFNKINSNVEEAIKGLAKIRKDVVHRSQEYSDNQLKNATKYAKILKKDLQNLKNGINQKTNSSTIQHSSSSQQGYTQQASFSQQGGMQPIYLTQQNYPVYPPSYPYNSPNYSMYPQGYSYYPQNYPVDQPSFFYNFQNPYILQQSHYNNISNNVVPQTPTSSTTPTLQKTSTPTNRLTTTSNTSTSAQPSQKMTTMLTRTLMIDKQSDTVESENTTDNSNKPKNK